MEMIRIMAFHPRLPGKPSPKVNASRFYPGNQILIKRGEGGKVKSLFFNSIAKGNHPLRKEC